MRRLFMTDDAEARGISRGALRWGARKGRWQRVDTGVWLEGPEEPSELDRARARVLASGGVGGGTLAGVLHGYDGVALGDDPHVFVAPTAATRKLGTARRKVAESDRCRRGGITVTTPLRTLLDLAATLDDDRWEQAHESALRRGDVTVHAVREAGDAATGWLVGRFTWSEVVRTPHTTARRRQARRTGTSPSRDSHGVALVVVISPDPAGTATRTATA